MIPHETLAKGSYYTRYFEPTEALKLLRTYPCAYFTCRSRERAAMYAEDFRARSGVIIFRRLGKRVIAEMNPAYASKKGLNDRY